MKIAIGIHSSHKATAITEIPHDSIIDTEITYNAVATEISHESALDPEILH